jgi:hypothetical protein
VQAEEVHVVCGIAEKCRKLLGIKFAEKWQKQTLQDQVFIQVAETLWD